MQIQIKNGKDRHDNIAVAKDDIDTYMRCVFSCPKTCARYGMDSIYFGVISG